MRFMGRSICLGCLVRLSLSPSSVFCVVEEVCAWADEACVGICSESAAYGGELVDGRGVGGAAEGLCERAAAVRVFVFFGIEML